MTMTDDPGRPKPQRSNATGWALAATTALLIGAAGFATGRATAPQHDHDADTTTCQDARQVYDDSLNQDDDLDPTTSGLLLANVVEQNPDCFDASERAQAQTIRDLLDRNAP